MNYRSHFQSTIIKLQRMLDDAQYHGDWGAYLRLRHRIIQLKDHIVDTKSDVVTIARANQKKNTNTLS